MCNEDDKPVTEGKVYETASIKQMLDFAADADRVLRPNRAQVLSSQ